MIYLIKLNDEAISSSAGDLCHIHYNGKLALQANNAGTLTFSFPRTHVSYAALRPMRGVISVTRDGSELWFGRVLSYVEDRNCVRTYTCEGALAFLNDVAFDSTANLSLSNVVAAYNQKAKPEFGGFEAGTGASITLHAEAGKTVFAALSDYIKANGGYFHMTRPNGVPTLNYTAADLGNATQEVQFGDNLSDISITANPMYLPNGEGQSISVKAFDKSFLFPEIEPFELLKAIRIVSFPHDVDTRITAEKLEIDLNNASASILTLGKTAKTLSEIK